MCKVFLTPFKMKFFNKFVKLILQSARLTPCIRALKSGKSRLRGKFYFRRRARAG